MTNLARMKSKYNAHNTWLMYKGLIKEQI